MPELPEVEITARLLDRSLQGVEIESALAPGVNALKTFDPPLAQLEGRRIQGVRRRGKHPIVEATGGAALLVHPMSAGGRPAVDKPPGAPDPPPPLLVRPAAGGA